MKGTNRLAISAAGISLAFATAANGHAQALAQTEAAPSAEQPGFTAPERQTVPAAQPGEVSGPPLQSTASDPSNAPTAAGPQAGIGDIIVTAQRRSETAQRTPLAITALSGDGLRQAGVNDLTDITRQAPNVQINSDGQGTTLLSIRGIGSTDVTEAGDSTVAVNIDGVYIARNTSISGLFYDIDRIEVLRGPQGTLYGRSATAGAINIISNKPTFDFAGAASLEYGNYNLLATSGMINAPLSDTVAARVAFQTRRHDGYADNGDGLHTIDQEDTAARAQILFKATDRLSVIVGGDFFHAGGLGGGFRGLQRPYPFNGNPYKFPLATRNFSRGQRDYGFRGEINYDFDFATLTYLGAYRATKADLRGEAPLFNTPYRLVNDQSQNSHELRLSGKQGNINWVVGANYFREYSDVLFSVDLGGPSLLFLKPDVGARSAAVFGQATYTITPGVRLTGGLRYTADRKYSFEGTNNLVVPGQPNFVIATQDVAVKYNRTTWRTGVDVDVAPNSLVYGSIATGYKPGGYFDGETPNIYRPEDITAYEIGAKNRFFDNRLQINMSVFYYDYKDLQVSGTRQINGTFAGIILNADSARVYGAEFESIYRITPNDQVDLTVGYLDARYRNFFLPEGDAYTNFGQPVSAPPVPVDLDEQRLAKSPSFTINAGYRHSFEFAVGGRLTPSAYLHFESPQNLEYHNFAITRVPSFTRTDLNLTYDAPGKKWYLTGYIRNVEDKVVATAGTLDFATNNPNRAAASLSPPRTYGVILGARF